MLTYFMLNIHGDIFMYCKLLKLQSYNYRMQSNYKILSKYVPRNDRIETWIISNPKYFRKRKPHLVTKLLLCQTKKILKKLRLVLIKI